MLASMSALVGLMVFVLTVIVLVSAVLCVGHGFALLSSLVGFISVRLSLVGCHGVGSPCVGCHCVVCSCVGCSGAVFGCCLSVFFMLAVVV